MQTALQLHRDPKEDSVSEFYLPSYRYSLKGESMSNLKQLHEKILYSSDVIQQLEALLHHLTTNVTVSLRSHCSVVGS